MTASPTQLTIKELESRGYKKNVDFEIVEYWNHFSKQRRDLWGMFDILLVDRLGVVGIQACMLSSFTERKKKITETRRVRAEVWLSAPYTTIEIWGWRKILERPGGKKKIWMPRITEIDIGDLRDERNTTSK